jgi:hypothetical protein
VDKKLGEPILLREALDALGTVGLRFRLVNRPQPAAHHGGDAELELRVGKDRVRYVAEIKRGLRPVTLGPAIHQVRTLRGNPLLVADHVTPPLADALRAHGVEFIDAAGNAFLNRPPLFVFIKGQRPRERRIAHERGRTFQPTGLQVVFALLARPELVGQPYRDIAAAAGVAHGTVGWVMAELPKLGFVVTVGGRRRLIDGERLLGQWTEAYARTLRPRLLLGRFHGDVAALQDHVAGGQDVLAGGELAAAWLTKQLRPATATFYVPGLEPRLVVGLKLRADPNGNVELRRRFWTFQGEKPGLVPELLVYADLLATGDARCLEIAELLRGDIADRLV